MSILWWTTVAAFALWYPLAFLLQRTNEADETYPVWLSAVIVFILDTVADAILVGWFGA